MNTAEPCVLRIEHLSKTFPGTRALNEVSLEVRPDETHALVGTNGSGKSTLIKTLAGYHRPDPGAQLWLNGEPLDLDASAAIDHHRLRFVHQDLGLINELNVMDNLALTRGYPQLGIRGIDWRTQRRTARALLSRFGVSLDVDRPLSTATPIERVVVAIAAALEGWEDGRCLLVLDEPTAVLPPGEVGRLFELIAEVRARGASVLYVSHRLDEIFEVADRVSVLRGGYMVACEDTTDLDTRALATIMVGEDVAPDYRADVPTPRDDDVVLEGRDLRGNDLRGVNFRLRRGEVLGVAGLPGSGREELPYAIAGALGRDVQGEFRLASDETGAEEWTKASSARKLGIPLVPADRAREALFAEMSVNENLTLRILDRMGTVRLDRRKDESAAQSWVDRLGIKASSLTDPIAWLSGGNQQKIVVSRALAEGSAVVVLCEPTAGVDIGSRIALYEFLAGEARKGLAVVVASSDVGDLIALCTRVLALRDGRCVAEIEGENLTEFALLRAMEAREEELA